ncbi:hypothetical protein ACEUBW_00740 [Aeromonas veronii]|uniref:hypothetical protein n=1 Tax=Aeromonas veronii TaxID=654 RepID=UPI0038D88D26
MDTKNCILLLGPSGIGKTTVMKNIQKMGDILSAVSLDNITHYHARELGLISHRDDLNRLLEIFEHDRERFFTFGTEALDKHLTALDDKPVLIDIGTGFLDAPSSLRWIQQYLSIALMADGAMSFDRFRKYRNIDITYEQYMTTQFCVNRLKAYNQATIIIRTDLIDEATTVRQVFLSIAGLSDESVGRSLLSQWLVPSIS